MILNGLITRTYYLDALPLGQLTFHACGYSEGGQSYSAHWPHLAYFCDTCGRIWAEGRNEYHFDYSPLPVAKWKVEVIGCEQHNGGVLVPTEYLCYADNDLLTYELSTELSRKEYR
jgi:hypothetical protein